jgi:RNA-splicing ligase RtcB
MDLKIFAENVEQSALEQIELLSKQNIFKDSKIRIMPDVHSGKGCVIGFTATIKDKIIPNLVGVDIGCGMYCVELGDIEIPFENLDRFIRNEIPSGQAVGNTVKGESFVNSLRCIDKLNNVDRLYKSLGSLGGGNHFIEIGVNSKGSKFLIIHSGSRNIGKQVADYYQKLAIEKCTMAPIENLHNSIIEYYKYVGKPHLIEAALKRIKEEEDNTIPKELCWIEGQDALDYWNDMEICTIWAMENRHSISRKIIRELGFVSNIEIANRGFHTIHNYIDVVDNIIRKGAIDANDGQKVLIPMNMRDGCLIGIGNGNEDWNCSAPHGAGRLMSRTDAKKNVTMEDFKNSMNGIFTSSVSLDTLDESPMAYKDSEYIERLIEPTVKIIDKIRPIYNFKGGN